MSPELELNVKKESTQTMTAAELLGLNILNADTEIARHNHAVAAHSGAPSSTRLAASSPAPTSMPSNFIPLTAVSSGRDKEIAVDEGRLDLEAVRAKLTEAQGPTYWRSLEELSGQPKFQEFVEREFGRQAPASWDALSRRDFLKVMGAGLALAGLTGCAFQPQEKIVPYVKAPEEIVPGKPLFYATAMPVGGGYVNGVLAESNMGRPTKIEGNDAHPASLGATDIFMQAAVLSMYDPERLQNVTYKGNASTWEEFAGAMQAERAALSANGGAGLRVLTTSVSSPTLAAQMAEMKRVFPQSQWISYDPINEDNAMQGAQLAFGRPVNTICRFDRAQRILSLDSDFLFESAGRVRYGRDFINGRRVRDGKEQERTEINRLYVAESTPTMTGAMADHRLPLKTSQIETLARLILSQMQPGATKTSSAGLPQNTQAWVSAVVADLQAHRGSSLVVAGAHQSPVVHAMAHAINDALGNVGKTLYYIDPVLDSATNQTQALRGLVKDMNAGRVQTLLIVGGNPVYEAPADLNFLSALKRVKTTIRLGTQGDETAFQSQWVLPETHPLEAWSDGRAFNGTTSIVQPLIAPLYDDARSAHEILAVFMNAPITDGYSIVENQWRGRLAGGVAAASGTASPGGAKTSDAASSGAMSTKGGGTPATGAPTSGAATTATITSGTPSSAAMASANAADTAFDKVWQKVLHDGIVPNTAAKPVSVTLNSAVANSAPTKSSTGLEISFRPDPTLWDGRWANSGWLQELPKPLTRLTWDNAALMGMNTARELGVTNEDIVQLKLRGRTVDAPVFVAPGHAEGAVTVHLGGGRTLGGRLLEGVGFDANAIRPSDAMGFTSGLQVVKLAGRHRLATVEDHFIISTADNKPGTDIDSTQNRDLVRIGDFAKYQANHHFLRGEFDQYIQYGNREGDDSTARSENAAAPGGGTEGNQSPVGKNADGKGEGGNREGAEQAAEQGLPTLYNNGWPSDPKGMGKDGVPVYTDRGVDDPDEVEARSKYNDPHIQYGYNDLPLPQWGMTIDLNSCIGCNACTIGCQAENNIATVGKDQVLNRREMHWIRIDTYFKGGVENPETYFQPVPCMHCEKAPCEGVCPVEATSHSAEGINEMTYNRCVGTKYCSNNCPYKVRRFNFLQYSDLHTPQIKLQQNPDVTVRARGVMEKCNYCVQRVTEARIQAEREDRPMRDGEVVTACQQACPTNAIVFGNIADMNSQVRKTKAHPLNYGILTELGTQPRTTYLARLRNPNPVLEPLESSRQDASHANVGAANEESPTGPVSPTTRENEAGNAAAEGNR